MLGVAVVILFIVMIIIFISQGNAISQLKAQIEKLESRFKAFEEPGIKTGMSGNARSESKPEPAKAVEQEKAKPLEVPAGPVIAEPATPVKTEGKPKQPDAFDLFLAKTGKVLFGGNLIMKVGGLVLFIGIAFFVKYMSPYFKLPMEVRLSGAALLGTAILYLGWQLRLRRKDAALILQGVGIGIVYLTLYAASGLFQLMSPMLAMIFMNVVVLLAVVLALLQQAPGLAFMGILGGFLAPVLIKSDSPNILVLFIYYGLLNAGVLAIRWFKKWESLEITGFVFTFAITVLWQRSSYNENDFSMVGIFLLICFVLFVLMQMTHIRHKQSSPGNIAKYVVYALPLMVSSIYISIHHRLGFSVAYGLLGMGAVYILSARFLWSAFKDRARWIVSQFLIIGSLIVTVGLTFAFEGRATNLVWALEGTALIILGLKEKKLIARLGGYVLAVYSGVRFLDMFVYDRDLMPFLNQKFASTMIIAVASLVAIYFLNKYKEVLSKFEKKLIVPLMYFWALCWWYGSGWMEIGKFNAGDFIIMCWLVISLSVFELILALAARRLAWAGLAVQSLIMPVMRWLLLIVIMAVNRRTDLFMLILMTVTVIALQYIVLRLIETLRGEKGLKFLHLLNYWLGMALLTLMAARLTGHLVQGRGFWQDMMTGLIPALIVYVQLLKPKWADRWPLDRFPQLYAGIAILPVMLYLIYWVLSGCFTGAYTWPVHYLPVINNLELTQAFILLLLLKWLWTIRTSTLPRLSVIPGRAGWYGFAVVTLIFITAVIGRSVHVFAGTNFNMGDLSASMVFQAWLSVIWTATALTIMVIATRKKSRQAWFGGAALLAIVILKLFLVDLSKTEALMRVVSFVGVGLLTLLLGYLSPLPPHLKENKNNEE